jgi:hypothetical protein
MTHPSFAGASEPSKRRSPAHLFVPIHRPSADQPPAYRQDQYTIPNRPQVLTHTGNNKKNDD